MTISDALAIQFWPVGEQTFNEKSVCGLVKQDCFCQPVNCDDEITLSIVDDFETGDIYLQTLDESLNQISLIQLTRSGFNLSITVSPSDQSPCIDQKLQFKIIGVANLQALASWTNQGIGTSWTLGANPSVIITGVFANSKFLLGNFNAIAGNVYDINYNIDTVDAGSILIFTGIYLLDSAFNIVASSDLGGTGGGNLTGTANLTPSANATYVAFRISVDESGVGSASIDVNSVSYNGGNVTLFKSDCIEVKDDHECTKLVEYSNESDFDGIVYSDTSPPPTFYLRIPAIFFEEENPQEQEDLELSNGQIVTLRQSLQEKRLLETGYMPNYMHKKLQKVLMHESITIDGDGWKRRDAYETNPIKKYALKRASVLLTKYNSVLKNTI